MHGKKTDRGNTVFLELYSINPICQILPFFKECLNLWYESRFDGNIISQLLKVSELIKLLKKSQSHLQLIFLKEHKGREIQRVHFLYFRLSL